MQRTWGLAAVAVASTIFATGCRSSTPTAPGTDVLRWTAKNAQRPSVVADKELGPHVNVDKTYVAQPDYKGPFTLTLHVENAPLEITEDGKANRRLAPVLVTAKLTANEDWTLSGTCNEGPDYQFGPVDDAGAMTTPDAMVLPCNVVFKYKDTLKDLTYSARFEIYGDGKVVSSLMGGKLTES